MTDATAPTALDAPRAAPAERRDRVRVSRRIAPYVMLAPYLIVMAIALVYPLYEAVILSFQDWKLGTPLSSAEWVGWKNYRFLLDDPRMWSSAGVTLVFAAAVVTLEMAIGVALALLLDRKLPGMTIFRTIFILPMMVAPIVVGLIWRFMYDEQFGTLNKLLNAVGLDGLPWLSSPDWALPAIILADVWQWTPFVFILTLAALQGLPRSVMEASRMDGATPLQTVFYIKLPLIVPVLVVTLLLRLIDAFKVLEVIFIMTDGGPAASTEVLALHLYKTAFTSQQLGRASALANLLLILVLVIGVALIIVSKVTEARARRAEREAAAEPDDVALQAVQVT